MPRKLISFDWAIKRILRSKANFEILEGFLSELLFEDITILEVLESETNKEEQNNKLTRIDIKVKNSKQEIILIEIQYSSELDYLQRILFATSKAITEHLKESAAYAKVSKIISVNILYFDFGDGDDYIYKGTTSFIGMHNKTKLRLNDKQKELYKVESVEEIYPEFYLIKVTNFNNIAKDSLDEWIYFLKNEEIKEDFKAKGINKAKESLDYLKMSNEEKKAYERFKENRHHEASLYESTYVIGKIEGKKEGLIEGKKEGLIEGKKEGLIEGKKEGLIEGEKNKQLEIAKNLLDVLDTEIISLKTGLSIEEIKKLQTL